MSAPTVPDENENPSSSAADSPESAGPPAPSAAPETNDAPPPVREETAATKFRQEIASHQANLDDFDPEERLWSGGYSPRAMIGGWIGMTLASIGLLAAAFLVPQMSWTLAGLLIILMWLLGICYYGSRRLGRHYELTTQRFIHRAGLVTRKTDRIEVIDIDDVSYTQGPVQRIFGVGSIVITGSDRTHPELTMEGIEKVGEVAGLVDDIRRQERRKRSLHIESI